jgi:hypothetical protein
MGKPRKMTMGTVPILDFRGLPILYPIHRGRVMVNWDPPKPAGWRQVLDPTMTEHGPGPSICLYSIYSGTK